MIAVIFTSGLITLFVSGIQLYQHYINDLSELDKRLNDISEIHLPGLEDRLWISDYQGLRSQAESLLKIEGVRVVSISDGESRLFTLGETSQEYQHRSYPLRYEYKNESIDIGTLDIVVVLDEVYARLIKEATNILTINGIKTFIVGLVFLFIFNSLITRHLEKISGFLQQFQPGQQSETLILNRQFNQGRQDELDIVVRAVNIMQVNINSSLNQVKDKSAELLQGKRRSEFLLDLLQQEFPNETELLQYAIETTVELMDAHSGIFNLLNSRGQSEQVYMSGEKLLPSHLSECVTCFDKNNPQPSNDTTCPLDKSLDTGEQYHNKLCVEILDHGKIIGIVSVYSKSVPYGDDEKAQLELYFNSVWNIVLQRRTRKALENKEQNYQTLVESSSAIPWEMDLTHQCFTYINPRIVDYLEYSLEELKKPGFWLEHIHQDDRKRVEQLFNQARESGKGFTTKYRVVSKSDREHWLIDYVNVVIHEGDVINLQGFIFDNTEQEELEQIFRRKQKMEAMDTLTGGIAHDYNNMLNVILGYSKLLTQNTEEGTQLSRFSKNIAKAADRASSLTKKLLQFSKQSNESLSVVSLNKLLIDDKEMLTKTLTPSIQISLNLDEMLGQVYVDQNGLQDSILNICINAMHAMPNGGELNLKTDNIVVSQSDNIIYGLDEGYYVRLTITDSGAGMDKATLEKVFDPFFSTKGENGTGLGLSQVYGLMRRSNGTVRIESEPGTGTSVAILLPRFEGQEENISLETLPSPGSTSGHERILIVDDEEINCMLAEDIVASCGYVVETALSAEIALAKLDHRPFDLVLSDVIMPGIDGFSLAREIRKRYPDVKIQLCSGYTDGYENDNETEFEEQLHRELLPKPYVPDLLLNRIRYLLDSRP
ncbi:MAG: response regulator [Gammaproteobacteria bacterium]|nr:response regulator [Gammaproteobacteria bacterium]